MIETLNKNVDQIQNTQLRLRSVNHEDEIKRCIYSVNLFCVGCVRTGGNPHEQKSESTS